MRIRIVLYRTASMSTDFIPQALRRLRFPDFLANTVVHERNLLENWNDGFSE